MVIAYAARGASGFGAAAALPLLALVLPLKALVPAWSLIALVAATALIGGIFSLWGAVVAGIFQQLVPFLFQTQWGLNSNLLLILFAGGLLQVLLTAPGGLAQQFPKDIAKLGRLLVRTVRRLTSSRGSA